MAEKGASKANQRQSRNHKSKFSKYLTRSTCNTCKVVFKNPKHRLAHVESGHKSLIGVSKDRYVKVYEPIFVK